MIDQAHARMLPRRCCVSFGSGFGPLCPFGCEPPNPRGGLRLRPSDGWRRGAVDASRQGLDWCPLCMAPAPRCQF